MSNVVDIKQRFTIPPECNDYYESGWLRNCQIVPKNGETCMFSRVNGILRPFLDGYAIIPVEEYERLKLKGS